MVNSTVWFQETSIPSPWMVIGNSKGGGGVSKAKIFEGKHEAKLEIIFLRGMGSNKKTVLGGCMVIWNLEPNILKMLWGP